VQTQPTFSLLASRRLPRKGVSYTDRVVPSAVDLHLPKLLTFRHDDRHLAVESIRTVEDVFFRLSAPLPPSTGAITAPWLPPSHLRTPGFNNCALDRHFGVSSVLNAPKTLTFCPSNDGGRTLSVSLYFSLDATMTPVLYPHTCEISLATSRRLSQHLKGF
jgi:hypothetical protein